MNAKHLLSALIVGILIGLAWPRPKPTAPILPDRSELEAARVVRDTIREQRIEYKTRYIQSRDTLPCPEALQMADSLIKLTEIELMETRRIEALQSTIITRMDTMYIRAVQDVHDCEKNVRTWRVLTGVGLVVGLIVGAIL